jgi:hypothetical protein
VLVVASPWSIGGRGFVDRALAAIGKQRFVHSVVESQLPYDALVNLHTGHERSTTVRVETVYDTLTGRFRAWGLVDGSATPGAVGAGLDPVLTGFADAYRTALRRHQARIVRERRVDGRLAKVLRFRLSPGTYEDVAVDATTYVPLEFQAFHQNIPGPLARIRQIETVSTKTAAQLRAPSVGSVLTGDFRDVRVVGVKEAATALGTRVWWLGPRIHELTLRKITLQSLRTFQQPNFRLLRHGDGLMFDYESSTTWLEVDVSPSWQVAYGFYGTALSADGPLGTPKTVRLACDACGPGNHAPHYKPIWSVYLRGSAGYIRIRSISRSLTLAAARGLKRMP